MTNATVFTGADAPALPLGIATTEITAEWMERMVNRFLREAQRQLSQIEQAKTGSDREEDYDTNEKNVGYRERNARTFARIVTAARDLVQLQFALEKRGLVKRKRIADARKSLERSLARLEANK